LVGAAPPFLGGGQQVRVFEAPGNLGFAGGVNMCLRHAPSADAWWILNPDTEPKPDALALMAQRLLVGDCEAVGCTLYRPDGSVQSYGGRWRPWLARAESIGIGRRVEEVRNKTAVEAGQNYLNGASLLVGRRFIDAVGMMSEDYFLYCEEVEWCLRALARGMRLAFAPDALVLHAQGATTGAGEQIRNRPRLPVYLNERNKMLLTRDLYPSRLLVAAVAALLLLGARYGRRMAWRQAGYGLAGWWAGLRNERGRPSGVAN
jgi:hypothetical protein